MKPKILALACVLLAIVTAVSLSTRTADAAGVTGTWTIRTFAGTNQTTQFSYPQKVNATIQPINITTSGQRSVTIFSSNNASTIYFTAGIGFYPAGINATAGKVTVSWQIPSSLSTGGTVTLAVGLAGVKTYETTVTLVIQQNFTQAVNAIMAPILSSFQGQIAYMKAQLDAANAALADSDFKHTQIEALLGIALASTIGYIVYDKRRSAGRKQEFERAAGEMEQIVINTAMEGAEPGERASVQAAAASPSPEKGA